MTPKPSAFEAALLLAPAVVLLLWGIPMVVIETWRIYHVSGNVAEISLDGWIGSLRVLAGLMAILEVVRLTRRTLRGERYRVGPVFLIAAVCGGIAAAYVEKLFGMVFAGIVSVPIVFLVAQLLRAQQVLQHQEAER